MKWFKKLNRPMQILTAVAILFVGSAVVSATYEELTMSDEDRAELAVKQKEEKEAKKLAKDEKEKAKKAEKEKKAEEKAALEKEEKAEVEKEDTVEEPVEETETEKPVEKKEVKPEKEAPKVKEEPKQVEAKKGDPVEEDSSWDDLKEKDKIVGVSDKDFSKVTKSKPSDVRNDKTGNWRITKISENIDIEEYALSYADLHMKDDEVHFIVNFNYHTTTWLNEINSLLYVEVREYVKREEHDAGTLGSGMILKSYVIYPDGDIQELDE